VCNWHAFNRCTFDVFVKLPSTEGIAAAGTMVDVAASARPLPFRLLPTAPTIWDPSSVNVPLNVRLDGCIVPSEAAEQGARIAYSHAGGCWG
jgi:hypothetical protein